MKVKKVAIFNDTRRTSHYGCEFVMQGIIAELNRRNIEPILFWPVGYDWRCNADFIEKLSAVDGIIVNGEGSIHHSKTSERAHYLTEVAEFFKHKYSIPSFLINSTMHELEDIVFINLKHFKQIYVRESNSRELLIAHGLNCKIVADITFLATRDRNSKPLSDVLLTDSVFSEVTSKLKKISTERNWDFTKLVHSCRPTLLDGWSKKEFLRRNIKWIYAAVLGKNIKNRYNFLDYIMSHKLVCTGRFHAVTLSFATFTPFLAIESNTPKISSLVFDVLGTTDRVINLSSVDGINADKYSWTEEEMELITAYLKSAKNSINEMFDNISAALDETPLN